MRHRNRPAMTSQSPAPPQSPAIAAFLRGVERRARLLAHVQTGHVATAQRALAVTAQVFATEAEQWPIAQWPLQYWRLLLSVPAMGQAVVADGCQLPAIAQLPAAARAAVLLHLVVCLDESDAAAALGIAIRDYQQRIRDALPRDRQGQPDLAVWRHWRDAVQQALEAADAPSDPDIDASATSTASSTPPMPTARASTAPPPPAPTAAPLPPPHRHLLRWLWLGVAVCLLALLATFFLHPRGRALLSAWHNRVRVEPLPAAAAPKATFDPADPANDPDRALFAAPQALLLARDLPLLAWLSSLPEPLSNAAPATVAPAPAPAPQWNRADLRQTAWLRGAMAEWQALTEAERSTLRATAAQFHTLPLAQQQQLRQRYAQQTFDAHRGWHLGPQLGRQWPRIAPLFAYVDAGERDALLQLLRNASADDTDTLARLAQITPPEARADLRRELLALPAAQRSAWLQARLNR